LLRVGVEWNADDGIHIGRILTTSYMNILQVLKKFSKTQLKAYSRGAQPPSMPQIQFT
jgi:hypothetical protein